MGNPLKHLNLKDISITDELFGSYVRKVSEKIIPHQWKILNDQLEGAEATHCIENFRIAAKEFQGERKGVVFQDTDLYKWLEAVAYCLASGQGKEYEELADQVIDLIGRSQEDDGYLNTYFTINAPDKKWTNLVEGHELYTSGHLMEAAAAYYEATGKNNLLNIAAKNADLICQVFGKEKGKIHGYPGHQEVELGLIKLYRITGKERYLDTANYFIRERGAEPNYFTHEIQTRGGYEFFPEFNDYDLEYSQAHKPPVQQTEAQGHAVRAMYMCAAMADLAQEYKNEELQQACNKIWNNVVEKRMYITGGIGSSGFRERFTTDYDLPNRTNYSETCASIGLMMFGQRMASLFKEAKYYDIVEQALYNTVLAGINIEGDRYFYVNPLEVIPEFCTEHSYMSHVKPVRQKWFSVACCPPNVARTLASLGQYIYAQDEDALYIHQFISSEAKASIGGSNINICMESQLLQNGHVKITVEMSDSKTIKIRIPSYAEKYQVMIDGAVWDETVINGYYPIELMGGKHELSIQFCVEPRWVGANERVQEDSGKAALVRGPLVYCLEEIDNEKLLSSVFVDLTEKVIIEDADKSLIGNVPVLKYKGLRIHNTQITDQLYGDIGLVKKETMLKAVPYCLWNNRGEGEMLVWQKVRI
jgi:DUF1680 family protein